MHQGEGHHRMLSDHVGGGVDAGAFASRRLHEEAAGHAEAHGEAHGEHGEVVHHGTVIWGIEVPSLHSFLDTQVLCRHGPPAIVCEGSCGPRVILGRGGQRRGRRAVQAEWRRVRRRGPLALAIAVRIRPWATAAPAAQGRMQHRLQPYPVQLADSCARQAQLGIVLFLVGATLFFEFLKEDVDERFDT
eukprot:2310792-Prymnesium_polylepis.1